LNRTDPKAPAIEIHGVIGGPLRSAFYDLDIRRKEMDRQGVDVHALSLTHPMSYWGDGAVGLRVSRLVNDAMVEAHRAFPDRFVGLATLPLQDPARSLEELDRVVSLPGIRGVYLGTNVNGRDLAHPDLVPVWARLEALKLPVFLHPINPIGKERTGPYYLHNLLGFPFDTTLAATHLIFGGTLDRFPRLVVGLAHSGGTLPYLVGRLDRGYKVRKECKHLKRAPSAYLRRFLYDTIAHAPDTLRYLIDRVGVERVLLGSDYCFDMGYPRPVEVVTRLTGLPRAAKAKILGATAARLLRLA
jgi:aminocarboxymuconate-semialdehyde decarboxylase